MMDINEICSKFGEIAGGKHHLENGTCSVTFHRNINVSILGKLTKSAHTIGASISFQSLDEKGYSLNLGEFALIDEEVYPFTKSLQDQGILVSALHNHWLFIKPNIMYAHFMSVENPLEFARKVRIAFNHLVR
ncbi:DUF1259 domain-containing protein [Bacillus sp. AFS017336]|nr:DUF1259 domain-containing protein [Bacillus sp. AFS017336]PEJ48136.1 methyltransferase [Bacillus sp. AFS002410]PEL00012.1 methyltransferase [Bacillus sp. AFS017336]